MYVQSFSKVPSLIIDISASNLYVKAKTVISATGQLMMTVHIHIVIAS